MRVLRSSLTLPSLFILLCLAQTQAKTNPQPSDSTYGNLPLTFEPNQGQLSPNFQFMSHGEDYSLSFQPDKVAVTLTSFQGSSFHSSSSSGRDAVSASTHDSFLIQLLGAAPNAQSSAEDPTITRSNYFLGNNPANWHTGIPNYRRIRYREIYPGIDLVYYGNHRRLEHDFIVAPYADPTRIELAFPDATTLSIDKDTGDLLIHTGNSSSNSTPRLLKPVSYQLIQGQRREITSHFALLDNQHVSFSLGSYDNSRALTIDPVLVYSTYLGGSGGGDQGNGIAVDSSGDAYIVGTTHSTDFPGTAGSFQTQDNAAANLPTVFVSKLNPAGTALVYSTYLGGSGGDYGYGIALDASNNAYITGATYSTDFPVTCNAFLPANPSQTAGAPTSFVAKLAANGAALTYSTYLGGSGSQSGSGDVSQAIAVDSSGDAYLTGYTFSADFPVTDSAFQATFAGNASISNAFVAKLNPGGTGLVYATYLGGSVSNQGYGGDLGNSIAIDSAGNAYIAGTTGTTDFPVSSNAIKNRMTAPTNGFVTELNPTATATVFSTYLGGSGNYTPYGDNDAGQISLGDTANAIAIDSNGSIYVAGNAASSDFPITAGALEDSSDFSSPIGFVTKFNKGGETLAYSTYLQGSGATVNAIAVDSTGTAYITGIAPRTSASQPGGFQPSGDALTVSMNAAAAYTAPFLVKLNPTATAMNYASLFGGSAYDSPIAIAVDAAGEAFLTGSTASTDFPVSQGAFQNSNKAAAHSASNAFITKLALAGETSSTTYPAPPTGLASALIILSNSITMYCDGYPGDNAFTMGVNLELTTAAGGPPTTGIFTFADSLNWQYDSEYMQPYTVQVQNTWGGGPNIFSVGDGEGYDGPEGPFSISWTATYSGDRVYAPFTVSGSADGPGCPSPNAVPSSPARRSAPRFPGPHIEILSGGKHVSSSSTSGNAVSPSSTTLTAAPSSQLRGAKFAPLPPASENGLSLRSHATTSQATGCIAPAQAATPVLSLATGTFTSSQSLTVTDATSGAAIYYTTDGSAPTASSTLYSGPITVASTETVNAIATAAGYTNSAVASATYTFVVPAAQPTFSPQSGTYTSAQTITLADTTPGAAIYYTTDGSTPTASATLYSAPVVVSTTETINAIAIAAGYTASSTASATYTITPTFTVTASSSSLTLSPGQSVTTTISIAPQYGFTGATTFSCTGLPAGVTCSFSPASVTPSAGAAISTTLTISASSTASLPRSDQQPGPGGTSFATPILAFVLATFRWRRRRLFRQLLLLAFTTSALTLLSACGGGHSSSKPVSSTISVVATSGTIQQAVKINIIVQ